MDLFTDPRVIAALIGSIGAIVAAIITAKAMIRLNKRNLNVNDPQFSVDQSVNNLQYKEAEIDPFWESLKSILMKIITAIVVVTAWIFIIILLSNLLPILLRFVFP